MVQTLGRYAFQLVFRYPYAENQHEGRLSRLAPHLVAVLVVKPRVRQGVVVQNLKQNF